MSEHFKNVSEKNEIYNLHIWTYFSCSQIRDIPISPFGLDILVCFNCFLHTFKQTVSSTSASVPSGNQSLSDIPPHGKSLRS